METENDISYSIYYYDNGILFLSYIWFDRGYNWALRLAINSIYTWKVLDQLSKNELIRICITVECRYNEVQYNMITYITSVTEAEYTSEFYPQKTLHTSPTGRDMGCHQCYNGTALYFLGDTSVECSDMFVRFL